MSATRSVGAMVPVAIEQVITKTATFAGTASADLTDLEGLAVIAVTSGAGGASATMTLKVQDCATSGGTYADVPGGTFDKIIGAGGTGDNVGGISFARINLNEVKPFIKIVATVVGTASYTYSATLLAAKKTQSGS